MMAYYRLLGLLAPILFHCIALGEDVILEPVIDGDWWQVAGNPDLLERTGERQQPVDFAIWQAADETWQIASCIRGTKCGGNTRLLYRWEGKTLFDSLWEPRGVFMEADPSLGEVTGGLQAPYVFLHNGLYQMMYGSWDHICLATSENGKKFTRHIRADGTTSLFGEPKGANPRDPQTIVHRGQLYCYYTAHPEAQGKVYCRLSEDLRNWGEHKLVAFGGSAGTGFGSAECPFVVYHEQSEYFYLFRTQHYPHEPRTSVYRSKDPLNFGVNDDQFLVCQLPVAAPEIFQHKGQYYVAALMPQLNGIRMARLNWRIKEK